MQERKNGFEYEDPFVEVLRIFAARGRAIREQRSADQMQAAENPNGVPAEDKTVGEEEQTAQDN